MGLLIVAVVVAAGVAAAGVVAVVVGVAVVLAVLGLNFESSALKDMGNRCHQNCPKRSGMELRLYTGVLFAPLKSLLFNATSFHSTATWLPLNCPSQQGAASNSAGSDIDARMVQK